MKRKLMVTILLMAAIVFGQEITGSRGNFQAKIEKSFAAEPGGLLTLTTSSGDITLSSWDKNTVQIVENLKMNVLTKEEAKEIVESSLSNYQASGSTIRVTSHDNEGDVQRTWQIFTPSKFNLDLETAGGDVAVSEVTGELEMRSAGGDFKLNNLSGTIKANTSGGDMDMTGISGTMMANTSGGDLVLRDIFAEANISTSGGDISASNTKNKVHLATSGGDITLKQIGGMLSASTSGGDIQLDNANGDEISLASMGGDIMLTNVTSKVDVNSNGGDIEGRHLDGDANIRTMGGEIKLTDIKGALRVQTMGGDVTVDYTLVDYKRKHTISIESMGGSVKLSIPGDMPASITAEIRLDRKSMDRFDIYSEFPLTKTNPDETHDRILRSKGDINGGGDAIYLHANGGDIHIKKNR